MKNIIIIFLVIFTNYLFSQSWGQSADCNGNKEETFSSIEYKNILPNLSINFSYNF